MRAPAEHWDQTLIGGAYGRDREAVLRGFGSIPDPVMDYALLEAILRWWRVLGQAQKWSAKEREYYRRLRVLATTLPINQSP